MVQTCSYPFTTGTSYGRLAIQVVPHLYICSRTGTVVVSSGFKSTGDRDDYTEHSSYVFGVAQFATDQSARLMTLPFWVVDCHRS